MLYCTVDADIDDVGEEEEEDGGVMEVENPNSFCTLCVTESEHREYRKVIEHSVKSCPGSPRCVMGLMRGKGRKGSLHTATPW